MRGRSPVSQMSPHSVRKHLRNIDSVLRKAGPRGHRNRDAAGILSEEPPWIKPPKASYSLPKIVALNTLGQACAAAVCMDVPRIDNIKPAAWWRALLLVAYNTGLRRRSLLELRMSEVNWALHLLELPPSRMKSGRPHVCHLNDAAMATLDAICRDRTRELVFPWPHCSTYFHTCLRRLLDTACIPRREHFGLQNLRATNGTQLWSIDPSAAQAGLGHSNIATTRRHYLDATTIVAKALDSFPQPSFAGEST